MPVPMLLAHRVKPVWDDNRSILSMAGVIIKQFGKPAANQRVLLCAFEAQGWPAWIADPLEPDPHMDNNQRLADAVYHLNKQENKLIRFFRDGRGKGVCWELVKKKSKRSATS